MTDRPHNSSTAASSAPAPTVLVVEADAAMRGFLQRLLERHGLAVLLAANPEQAQLILAREWVAPAAIVHGADLLRGENRRHGARLARQAGTRPVLVYGADAGSDGRPTEAGRRDAPSAGATPFDGEQLVRDLLVALRSPSPHGRDDQG